jgi:hypothetical protein
MFSSELKTDLPIFSSLNYVLWGIAGLPVASTKIPA